MAAYLGDGDAKLALCFGISAVVLSLESPPHIPLYSDIYMRVEQKVLNRGLHCEGPGACIYHSRLKFFPEMAKENSLLAKDLAKV